MPLPKIKLEKRDTAWKSQYKNPSNQLQGPFILKLIRHFTKFLKSALEKPKQMSPSFSFNKRKKKCEQSQQARQEKKKVKQEWSRRDTEIMLATRHSHSQQAKQRKALSYETTEEAVQRAEKRKRQEGISERKIKRYSPPPNQVDFHKENLLRENWQTRKMGGIR